MDNKSDDKWHSIWAQRPDNLVLESSDALQNLILLDGFDTGAGDYTVESWRRMASAEVERHNLNPSTRVFEIGCGAGAFLFALKEKCGCEVSGVDYSEKLIEAGSKIVDGNLEWGRADNLNCAEKSMDVVFSHGVFHYFPDLDYVETVIGQCDNILKSGGSISLMDICDKDKESIYHEERRKMYSDPSEYDRKYADLKHLFIDKTWLQDVLRSYNLTNIEFYPHAVAEYGNSEFRYNIYAEKQ